MTRGAAAIAAASATLVATPALADGTGLAGLGTLGLVALLIVVGIPALGCAGLMTGWNLRLARRATSTGQVLRRNLVSLGAMVLYLVGGLLLFGTLGDLHVLPSGDWVGTLLGLVILGAVTADVFFTARLLRRLGPEERFGRGLGIAAYVLGALLCLPTLLMLGLSIGLVVTAGKSAQWTYTWRYKDAETSATVTDRLPCFQSTGDRENSWPCRQSRSPACKVLCKAEFGPCVGDCYRTATLAKKECTPIPQLKD
jgi:hypothetical protein